jgi:hypothetical protein
MSITRTSGLAALAAGAPAVLIKKASAVETPVLEIAKGPYQGTRESLTKYRTPDWFRGAKLGIWAIGNRNRFQSRVTGSHSGCTSRVIPPTNGTLSIRAIPPRLVTNER